MNKKKAQKRNDTKRGRWQMVIPRQVGSRKKTDISHNGSVQLQGNVFLDEKKKDYYHLPQFPLQLGIAV